MGIVVQTNVPALIAQNNLTTATNKMNQAMERMTTGYKINSAKDDAAGLYVATSLDKNIRGSKVAQQNVQMGNDMLAVAEGDLVSIQDNLMRIRDLALTAANGVYDQNSMAAIIAEIDARKAEIDRAASVSQYNGKELLSTNAPDEIVLQVGANATDNDVITVTGVFGDATSDTLGLGATFAANAENDAIRTYVGTVDTALKAIQDRRTAIGAVQNRLDSTSQSLTTTIENLTSSKSTIMDADVAAESSEYINGQILQQSAASLLVQANQAPQVALSLV